ncbi:MAG: hypothetical protein NZ959_04270 [Armatimonadetes bacterium]|nr:hypothetical protein [Armatimonadota bacterium]MDW8121431.1 hypothetical protein [Armatimonadota bacterium]
MLTVATGENQSDQYLCELLLEWGLPFSSASWSNLDPERQPLFLIQGKCRLTQQERDALRHFVESGGALIVIGADLGLGDLLGVDIKGPLTDGWLRLKSHSIGCGLKSSLHIFGGVRALARDPTDCVGYLVNDREENIGDAIVIRRFGRGLTIFLAPDVTRSILHIQQGLRIEEDGSPAPDGSAPIDDGILKAEDGLVLDWEKDRIKVNGLPFFGRPITDELRILLLQTILFAASEKNLPLPMISLWSKGRRAMGLVSHDTDGNDPELGYALLEEVNRIGIESCWCIIYPGQYPKDLYRRIVDSDGEIALHYDALTESPLTRWSQKSLRGQRDWLIRETGFSPVSNKNHYTRWEGRLEFYRWCQQLGLRAEQSKGPSKLGTLGFPFGGCHPWRPFDDESEDPQVIDVWSLNLLTQDLVVDPSGVNKERHPIMVSASYGEHLIDEALRVGGLAHFLFHPAHIKKPGTAAALERLVAYGRDRGLEWQTSAQIAEWLTQRSFWVASAKVFWATGSWILRGWSSLPGSRLLALAPRPILSKSEPVQYWFGFPFRLVAEDLTGGDFALSPEGQ